MARNKLFEKICCKGQYALKEWLIKRLKRMGKTVITGDGYIFSDGEFPVLLTAHMDTVHKKQCTKIRYMQLKDGKTAAYEPDGIGGDDRCGIYMILKLLERIDCPVLFCEDEEIGSIGAKKFVKTDLCTRLKDEKKLKYIIELDRANSYDAVFYEDDNTAFHDFICKEFWREDYGSWSDICTLSPALEISSVNLSCGYYKAHTTSEYVILDEMEKAIEETYKLLLRTDLEAEPFKYTECVYHSRYWDYGYKYGGYDYNNQKARYSWNYYDDDDDDYSQTVNISRSASTTALATQTEKKTVRDANHYLEVLLTDGSYIDIVCTTDENLWERLFFDNPTICASDIVDYFMW